MDFSLTDEQITLQKKARAFALNEILPVVRYFDEHDEMPVFLIKRAHEEGLSNLSIEKKYGGLGYGLFESCLVIEEISAASPAMGTSIFGSTLGLEPLMLCDNDAAKSADSIFLTTPGISVIIDAIKESRKIFQQ
ncbi:MAG: acyl-CoA dehydrogenase family protein, partial [Candidatus Hodarchaeota archaeon]